VRTIYTNHIKSLAALTVAAMTFVLASCGGSGATTTTTPISGTSNAAIITLSPSATSVNSDGSNPVTLTATTLSSGNALLSGQTLTISTTAGQVSTSSITTDTNGQASIIFSSGATRTNGTATITVATTSGTASASIPIQITGSTLSLTSSATSAATGSPVTIAAVAKDAGNNVVSGQTLRYSIAASSTGSGTLSATAGTTDFSGATSFTLTGTAGGNVDVLVEWLNTAGATTTSKTVTVTFAASAGTFSVVTPSFSPYPVSIGINQNVVINVPATVSSIRYASTLGTWVGGTSVLTVANPGTGTDTRTFVPGNNAGNASVQIDALDATGAVISTANFIFSITANAASAISLQSNVSVVPPSSGTTSSTATFTAKVIDAIGNPVGGAPVQFTLVNSTGTGETLSPVIASTNTTGALGEAQTTFTAGTSTSQNAAVKAMVVGTALSATKMIVVGGTVGSIAIGVSDKQASINSDTSYELPVTVLVSDSNGNAVSGATVSLSLWPVTYYYGYRDIDCKAVLSGLFHSGAATPYSHANEDANRNYLIDAGEDTDSPGNLGADGLLTPPQADGGTIPATVTTGADGTATFKYVFLKKYANWLTVRLTASTTALGNPTATSDIYLLPLASDVSGTACGLVNSPYN